MYTQRPNRLPNMTPKAASIIILDGVLVLDYKVYQVAGSLSSSVDREWRVPANASGIDPEIFDELTGGWSPTEDEIIAGTHEEIRNGQTAQVFRFPIKRNLKVWNIIEGNVNVKNLDWGWVEFADSPDQHYETAPKAIERLKKEKDKAKETFYKAAAAHATAWQNFSRLFDEGDNTNGK